ncbi:MAG: D-2-hydroxyacid dehydrogenase [Chromatiales bacterium]|jgi:phosphoglycerate dehydrogenase-like enzyme|nr:D-2-hydroxyacid dehydrogenase [Chromatiales bacterium]
MPNIVSLIALSEQDIATIKGVDPSIRFTNLGGWFQDEYAETWPPATVARYVPGAGSGTREERDALLAEADIILGGFPYPLDLVARAPKLQWLHQTPAGASNLRRGDLWGAAVPVTTSRGYGDVTAIAEYAIAGIVHFAKGFDRAEVDRVNGAFDHRQYGAQSIEGKTLCVIGAGGIGREVARFGTGLGMRAVGTRTHPELSAQDPLYDCVKGPDTLLELLAQSDFVAVCCQWTDDTTNLLNGEAFAAMRPGAIVVNVARGEIIDEAALLDALDAGQIRGAVLDVYVGEFDSLPPQRLWQHPRVLITPHTSAQTDHVRRRSTELFCRNLRGFLDGQPLENQIDWAAGY